MTVRAGRLRHRVTIQRRVEAQAASGEVTWVWEDWLTIWAAVIPARGTKYLAASQIEQSQMFTLRVRYRVGYRTDMRIKYAHEPGKYQYYDIVDIVEINERRREMELMCRMREADGFRSAK